nr:unnamed protein product [Digitaria exilis]
MEAKKSGREPEIWKGAGNLVAGYKQFVAEAMRKLPGDHVGVDAEDFQHAVLREVRYWPGEFVAAQVQQAESRKRGELEGDFAGEGVVAEVEVLQKRQATSGGRWDLSIERVGVEVDLSELSSSGGRAPESPFWPRTRADRAEHDASAGGTVPVKLLPVRSSTASSGSEQSRGAEAARSPESPIPERLSAATAPVAEQVTPRNAQCGPLPLPMPPALVFHDGRRRRWEASGMAARKERRTSAELFDAGVVAEVADGIARSRRRTREDTSMGGDL